MNFYPHHIGDYAQATRHLTMLEHGAYRLLLDLYYSQEAPLPADVAKVQRLTCARSREERAAVETVLREFFVETSDGWRHGRCDREIEVARRKADAARENGKKGGRKPKPPPSGPGSGTHPEPGGFPPGSPPGTQGEAPNPNPNPNPNLASRDARAPVPARASPVDLAVEARKHGVLCTGSDPRVIAAAEQGVSVEQLRDAIAAIERRNGPDAAAPSIGYVLGTLQGWAADAARLRVVGAAAPGRGGVTDEDLAALQAKLEAEAAEGSRATA